MWTRWLILVTKVDNNFYFFKLLSNLVSTLKNTNQLWSERRCSTFGLIRQFWLSFLNITSYSLNFVVTQCCVSVVRNSMNKSLFIITVLTKLFFRWTYVQMSGPWLWQGLYPVVKFATTFTKSRISVGEAKKSTFSLCNLWQGFRYRILNENS